MKSAFKTIEKYWYLFAIFTLTALVLVVSFLENSKLATLLRTLKDTAQNYKKRVDTIDKLTDNKILKDKKVVKTYEERAKEIQEKREKDLEKVNAKKIEVVKDLKDKSSEELAQKLKEEFKL